MYIKLPRKVVTLLKIAKPWHIIVVIILFSVALTTVMSIILRGRITHDYLITGAVVSLIASSMMSALITEIHDIEKAHMSSKIESIGVLAGGIAHDFNNIIQSVLGNIDLAKLSLDAAAPSSQEILKTLKKAEEHAKHAGSLATKLMTFSYGGDPEKTPGDIKETLKDTVALTIDASNFKCIYDLPDDLWNAEYDRDQMKHVFGSLIINAQEAMGKKGVISITAVNVSIPYGSAIPLSPGKYVEISIKDHGCGIRDDDLTKIFDPYFSTKEKGNQKGLGLGLAIAWSIVKKHDGYITVDSKYGVGSVFHVYMPART